MKPPIRNHLYAGFAAGDRLNRKVDVRPVLSSWDSRLRRSGYVRMSEASLWMLSRGDAPAERHRMWVRMGGPPGQQIVLFDFQRTGSASRLPSLLQGVSGYLQSNGDVCYQQAAADLGLVSLGCFEHCRLRIGSALRNTPASMRWAAAAASCAVRLIDELYAIEREAQCLDPDKRVALRKCKAAPVLARLQQWLSQRLRSGGDLLEQAFKHCLSRWPDLIRYLDDGSVQIDNSALESAICSFSAGLDKWLFAESEQDAVNAAALYSFIATANVNSIEPHSYLRWLFDELPAARSDPELQRLLPFKVKHGLSRKSIGE